MNYLKGVIFRMLILIGMCISVPLGVIIITIGSIIGFILDFEINDDVCKTIMLWPITVLNKLFGGDNIYKI